MMLRYVKKLLKTILFVRAYGIMDVHVIAVMTLWYRDIPNVNESIIIIIMGTLPIEPLD